MSKAKINKVYIVGEVEEVATEIRTTNDGRTYINGKIVVKSIVNGTENLIDVKVLAFEKTKSGETNRLYTNYTKLDSFLHKKVTISGELRDGSMVNNQGNLIHFNEIYLRFINPAKSDAVDTATFEYSGFVVKALYERKNKDDELLGYRIEVAQANYNDTAMSVLRFDVDKQDVNIAQAIEANYETQTTVSFSGVINYISISETRTEEVAFGAATPKTFVRSEKVFRITGGKEPYGEDDPAAYTAEEIQKFVADYKAADADRLEKAKNGSDTETATTAAPNAAAAAMQSKIRPNSLI